MNRPDPEVMTFLSPWRGEADAMRFNHPLNRQDRPSALPGMPCQVAVFRCGQIVGTRR